MISPRDVASLDAQPTSCSRPDDTHFDVPDLIPARMLNEFAYCPRLSYLEWVQSEWADNLETDQGTFGHSVVDKPSRGAVPEGAERQGLSDEDQESANVETKQEHPEAESPCPLTLRLLPTLRLPFTLDQ